MVFMCEAKLASCENVMCMNRQQFPYIYIYEKLYEVQLKMQL